MSFRTRIALAGAAAVAVAVAAASAITYVVVRGELRSEIDAALRSRAATTRLRIVEDPGSGLRFLDLPPAFLGGASGYLQLVTSDGKAIRPIGERVALPITDRDREAAEGGIGEAFFSDADVQGTHVRVLTLPLDQGYALQISRPLDEVDSALARIRNWLLVVAVVGMGIAAALGLVVARAALAPVRRLTRTAEEVTETRDLSRRIDEEGRDELGRLATSFNTMLAALEASARSQRQLVSDASHELRTPLTSLRTNIEVLARDETLPAGEREALLRDVTQQLGEMTVLVAELVELARGDKDPVEPEDVRLDLVTAEVIERTKRNHPGIAVSAELEETLVHGVRATIERAVSNLLDNAAKWSPPEGEIQVTLHGGELTVRDHGPGIAEADLPFVFDRFYRAPSARGMPGSGLGLAIVRQVAEAHGGSASVEAPAGGGTQLRLVLPTSASAPAS
jgi:two-component system sensor histidine kinase MprB